jgi:hypothetical protein
MMLAPVRRLGREAGAVVRADTATHLHLRERLVGIWLVTLFIDVAGSALVYVFEHGKAANGIQTVGDAVFWTTAQLLTVSSQMPNPVTAGGKVVDLFLEIWAISAVTALAGSFGAFFHRRGMERHALEAQAGVDQASDTRRGGPT